ncbi:hypothetical protein QJS04_geneDACA019875 [Acorus gramineus]|uniref:Uncharacterized protein n=1 Tax=Acorus gramineus TaxID=55184 RepID=A0AAV9BW69_ACOGR|nr:hypothetical protein QJS04_geneDACA019875 [Acorus gramineus]
MGRPTDTMAKVYKAHVELENGDTFVYGLDKKFNLHKILQDVRYYSCNGNVGSHKGVPAIKLDGNQVQTIVSFLVDNCGMSKREIETK